MPQTRVVPFPLIRDSGCASVCMCACVCVCTIYILCVCALVVRSLNRCVWFFGTLFIHNILLSVSDKLYHRCMVPYLCMYMYMYMYVYGIVCMHVNV